MTVLELMEALAGYPDYWTTNIEEVQPGSVHGVVLR